jgi:hypothetical protein
VGAPAPATYTFLFVVVVVLERRELTFALHGCNNTFIQHCEFAMKRDSFSAIDSWLGGRNSCFSNVLLRAVLVKYLMLHTLYKIYLHI